MKKQVVILAVSLFLLSVVTTFARDKNTAGTTPLPDEAVTNYIADLSSGNLGVRTSAAYFAGEYNIEDAVIPLMKMLNSEKSEGARIMAALSLTKIGTGQAVFAVKQAAKFDSSERVRNLCETFYNSYSQENIESTDSL